MVLFLSKSWQLFLSKIIQALVPIVFPMVFFLVSKQSDKQHCKLTHPNKRFKIQIRVTTKDIQHNKSIKSILLIVLGLMASAVFQWYVKGKRKVFPMVWQGGKWEKYQPYKVEVRKEIMIRKGKVPRPLNPYTTYWLHLPMHTPQK